MLLLSRFWYLFLAVIAASAVGAALLGQGIINHKSDRNTVEQLRRDRFELEVLMQLDARRRIDRLAFITVDTKTGSILQKAIGLEPGAKLWELNTELKKILHGHTEQLVQAAKSSASAEEKDELFNPDIVIAVDRKGRIIAQLGPLAANPPGTGIGTFPLVRRSIRGYLRDDVWVYDRRVYRMAARPVIYGGNYVGAIIHGYRFDSYFVKKLAKNLGGASVAFFYGTDILASHSPTEEGKSISKKQMEAPLQTVLTDEKIRKGESAGPIELDGDGLAIYSLAIGSASRLQVGYSIARPKVHIASPIEMFDSASEQDIRSLPFLQLILAAIGLFLAGILFLFLERDRPFRRLIEKTREIAKGERDRLIITEWRGGYRKLADQVNLAIDKEVETAAKTTPSKKKVDLDEILGPTPEEGNANEFFGFASADENAKDSSKEDFFPPPPPPSGSLDNTSALGNPPLPNPMAGGPPVPPHNTTSNKKQTPPSPAPPISHAQPDNGNGSGYDEDTHFKEIFEQYLETRKQCGEATENLSYEKFLVTLQKNRDQIVSQHGVKEVRFSVYVKNGKAALKAMPIKN